MTTVDVVVIGAGAAGLMCAMTAGGRGRKVVVLDHAQKPGEKIRISGGGRCNFTNLHVTASHFLSQNPSFCRSALARFGPSDFIDLVKKHQIAFHEKELGQLFCDGPSTQIVAMLLNECAAVGVDVRLQAPITQVDRCSDGFVITSHAGSWQCSSLVIATGGLSIPKMGATGFGYDIARQFGIPIISPYPGLVPLRLGSDDLTKLSGLAGIAVSARLQTAKQVFARPLLFTHKGLSGPGALQISSYWQEKSLLQVDLCPDHQLEKLLLDAKQQYPRQELASFMAQYLPKRVAQSFLEHFSEIPRRLADMTDKSLRSVAQLFNQWQIVPTGTEGYQKAEVTVGGVDTSALSSQTMQAKAISGLFFVGEVVDMTGHLGGYNFQWAWSSGFVAGQNV